MFIFELNNKEKLINTSRKVLYFKINLQRKQKKIMV